MRPLARPFLVPGLRPFALLLAGLLLLALRPAANAQEPAQLQTHFVRPGDTWQALAVRYGATPADLQLLNGNVNQQRQPAIGSMIQALAVSAEPPTGAIISRPDGGVLDLALSSGVSPWAVTLLNDLAHPYRPVLHRPLFVPGPETEVRQLPDGLKTLELAAVPARPGRGLALRATLARPGAYRASLAGLPLALFEDGLKLVGLVGTGAFFEPGDHELTFRLGDGPLWTQPWRVVPGDWTFQQITLTGDAATITAEEIQAEHDRLFEIWSHASPTPLWQGPFRPPVDQYLELSSLYGARRSYNGGPYRSYHEGLDYSAYGGTPVLAPADGTVVLAEVLRVRGGAVIIDHGLGVYSGFYHLSEVVAQAGLPVAAGEMIGRVGTTGLSTGNHLHWDLLVNGTWVDPAAWLAEDTACWLLAGWGSGCAVENAAAP